MAAAELAAAKAKAKAPPAAMQPLPKVIAYDEATWLPETAQDARTAAEHHPPTLPAPTRTAPPSKSPQGIGFAAVAVGCGWKGSARRINARINAKMPP